MTICHCGAPVKCRGLCADHYLAYYRSPDFTPAVRVPVVKPPCTVPGCCEPTRAKGLCEIHRRQRYWHDRRVQCKPGHNRHSYSLRGTCVRCGAPKHRTADPGTRIIPCTARINHHYGDDGRCVHCGAVRLRDYRAKPATARKPRPVLTSCTGWRHEYGEDGLCVHCGARRLRQPPSADAGLRVRYA